MEIIAILVALAVVGYFIFLRKKEDVVVVEEVAPYKVETPEPAPKATSCGCGRSPSGSCVGLHALSESEWNVHPDNPNKIEVVEIVEVVVVEEAPAKKPRKPRAPKAEKPAAKKAAPKKVAAPKKPKATKSKKA